MGISLGRQQAATDAHAANGTHGAIGLASAHGAVAPTAADGWS